MFHFHVVVMYLSYVHNLILVLNKWFDRGKVLPDLCQGVDVALTG